ncbi:MAG: PD-(D/E)XK nuclease family protein [Magnetococcales bacterium]|nr:PD-(D/E)XK nuclease family protein [Magnetococcales bacterium]
MLSSSSIQGIEALSTQLDRGCVVVTVNQRLSGHLSRRMNAFRAARGQMTWPTVDIIPLQAWLRKLWLELLNRMDEPPGLLSPWAERQLWLRIIAEYGTRKKKLMWPHRSVALAMEGWQLLCDWHVSPRDAEFQGHEDTEAFAAWVLNFQREIERRRLVTQAELPGFLQRNGHLVALPPGIVLAGFDTWSPALAQLFASMEKQGTEIMLYVPESFQASPSLRMLLDHEEEIRCAAHWAKDYLDSRLAQDRNPIIHDTGSIAIIHPALGQWRTPIIRIFSQVFYPGAREWHALPESPLFNLSMGFPLREMPVIADALFFLHVYRDGFCTPTTFSRLLLSPYCLGGAAEHLERAGLDILWRAQGWQKMTLRELHALCESGDPPPRLATLLAVLQEGELVTKEMVSPAAWAKRFAAILTKIGWPGAAKESSTGEYPLVQAWNGLLFDLSSLEAMEPALDYDQALAILEHGAGETLYQPEGGREAPVQLLGSLEAGGETFAALWIMGLSDEEWPPQPKANPFLPRGLQKRLGMPRSSSEREYEFATRITASLLTAAPEVVVSYPGRDGDRALRVSPLVGQLPERVSPPLKNSDFSHEVWRHRQLETISDDTPPPLAQRPGKTYPTGVIKAQSLCPFQAFARFRLHATSMPVNQSGLSPSERGQLTHRVLAELLAPGFSLADWQQQLTDEKREAAVTKACDLILDPASVGFLKNFPEEFVVWERKRQIHLVTQWMRIEERRERNFTVKEVEKEGSWKCEDLELSYRMDRIDGLEDDALVIIDYKTGAVRVGDWFGDRPRDPQMPIYALAVQQKTAALVYGQLSATIKQFTGLAETPGLLPGVSWKPKDLDDLQPPAFSELTKHWHAVIATLAREFVEGKAAVSPLPGACKRCDLHPLCRVDTKLEDARNDLE